MARVLVVLLVLGCSGSARAQAGFRAETDACEKKLVAALDELAKWCSKRGMLRERDDVCRSIIVFDEDHARARRILKYRKKDGRWVKGSYRQSRRTNEKHKPTYDERIAKIRSDYLEAMNLALECHGADLPVAVRESALQRMVAMAPEDEKIRAALGQAKYEDRWVLKETAAAKERRPVLKRLVAEARSAAGVPKDTTPTAHEKAVGLEFLMRRTKHVRVVGPVEEFEIVKAAESSETAAGLFRSVFGIEAWPLKGFTVYLIGNDDDKRRFLRRHPQVTDRERELAERVRGFWIPGNSKFVDWGPGPAERIDGATRQTIMHMLLQNYGISGKQGWIVEGVGLYLGFHVTGTRLTWFVSQGGYDHEAKEWRNRLLDETRWLREACDIFRGGNPGLLAVMGRDVNEMSIPEMLVAHALAAYLFEGRPDKAAAVVEAAGKGTSPAKIVREILGMEIGQLEDRLGTWLEEMVR